MLGKRCVPLGDGYSQTTKGWDPPLAEEVHKSSSTSLLEVVAPLAPLSPYSKLSAAASPQTLEARALMVDVLYRSAIGSLMYLAVCTRLDISAAVNSLSKFNADPREAHWEAVQHILRYLKGIAGEGICYKAGSSTKIWGYYDSSQLLTTATLSSCESEYLALSAATQEASFLRQLQIQMQGPAVIPSPICCGVRQSIIALELGSYKIG